MQHAFMLSSVFELCINERDCDLDDYLFSTVIYSFVPYVVSCTLLEVVVNTNTQCE